jgi:hypothetical protein
MGKERQATAFTLAFPRERHSGINLALAVGRVAGEIIIARKRFDRDQLLRPLIIVNRQDPLYDMARSRDQGPFAQVHFANHAEAKFMIAHKTFLSANGPQQFLV